MLHGTCPFSIDRLHQYKFLGFMQLLCISFLFKISTLKLWSTFVHCGDMGKPIKSCFCHPCRLYILWILTVVLINAHCHFDTCYMRQKVCMGLKVCYFIILVASTGSVGEYNYRNHLQEKFLVRQICMVTPLSQTVDAVWWHPKFSNK